MIRQGKVEMAPTSRLSRVPPADVAAFMRLVTDIEEFLLTDESRLGDFVELGDAKGLGEMHERIARIYKVVVEGNPLIVEVLERVFIPPPPEKEELT
jgi:hypothetical protein